MRTAIALLALMTSAHAETRVWGSAVNGKQSSVTVEAGSDHFADVTCRNELTATEMQMVYLTMTVSGVPLSIVVDQGGGIVPDTFTVAVPEGFMAIPGDVTLKEGQSAVIRVVRLSDEVIG